MSNSEKKHVANNEKRKLFRENQAQHEADVTVVTQSQKPIDEFSWIIKILIFERGISFIVIMPM